MVMNELRKDAKRGWEHEMWPVMTNDQSAAAAETANLQLKFDGT